ncbi:MAG: sensor histidine kinase [Eubacteriales bacterium]|nr:sensor histidine kinase [Eubacteriales bacterium]
MKRTRGLSYRAKLIWVNCVTILVVAALITVGLVLTASRQAVEDGKTHLNLLTEQVLINFSNATKSAAQQVITMLSGTGTAERIYLLRDSSEQDTGYYQRVQELLSAMNQMISAKTYYRELYIRMDDGRSFANSAASQDFAREADALLSVPAYGENTHGSALWVRSDGGNLCLIRDVYNQSPFRHVGKVVALMRPDFLASLGEYNADLKCTVLFLNSLQQPMVQIGDEETDLSGVALAAVASPAMDIVDNYAVSVRNVENWTAVGLLPEARLNAVRASILRSGFLLSLLCVMGGTLLVFALTNRMTRQVRSLVASMDDVAAGNMSISIPVDSRDEFGQLAVHFNRMINQTAELLSRVVREEQEKSKAEYGMLEYRYRSLQSQINPHFIYNAMETVNALAKIDGNEEISEVVQHISAFFRQNTYHMQKRFIPIDEEFESLRQYTQIYRHIHGNRLSTPITCAPEAEKALIPTMILQPVLENALIYGVRPFEEETLVMLGAMVYGDRLVIEITDNGCGMSPETVELILNGEREESGPETKHSTGIGMRNVKERLHLIYGEQARLSIQSQTDHGTTVTIEIPLVYEEGELELLLKATGTNLK